MVFFLWLYRRFGFEYSVLHRQARLPLPLSLPLGQLGEVQFYVFICVHMAQLCGLTYIPAVCVRVCVSVFKWSPSGGNSGALPDIKLQLKLCVPQSHSRCRYHTRVRQPWPKGCTHTHTAEP